MDSSDDEFFVEDESLSELLAAYEAGEKGLTLPPTGASAGARSELVNVSGSLITLASGHPELDTGITVPGRIELSHA